MCLIKSPTLKSTKKNGGLPLLASGILSIRYSWVIAIMTAIFSIAIPACFGKLTITLLSLATIIVGIFYSFRPMFFSGRIFLDFFTNALGFGIIAFGAGWSLAGREFFPFSLFVKAALPYFLLMCAGSISSTIPDISGDREGHKFTTAVVLGEQKAHLVAFLFVAAASIDAVMVNDVIASICAIAALPFYFLHSLWPKQVFAEATYKVGGALCMIAAGCITPLFFPCALAVFLLTWMYFRFRHGVIYPSLTPAPNAAPSTGKK
jgi:4-hydroxybenzoate polyprenyltransferase